MAAESQREGKRTEHHIWCNFWNRPVETCEMCKRAWELYPYDSPEEAAGLAAKHFPDAIEIK